MILQFSYWIIVYYLRLKINIIFGHKFNVFEANKFILTITTNIPYLFSSLYVHL